jgi:hypothetical protein
VSNWVRVHGDQGTGNLFNVDITTIAAGHTLLRMHAGYVLRARVPIIADPNEVSQYIVAVGFYTRLATGGTIIHPVTNPADTAPPTQRWLYWRPTALIPAAPGYSGIGGWTTWSSEPATSEIDVRAMVKATPGDVKLAISWEQTVAQPADATVTISWWASVLVS